MISLWADADHNVEVNRLETLAEVAPLVRLFDRIAGEEGWQPGGAFQEWQARSAFFALYQHERLIGGLQLVMPDPLGTLPCQSVWPEVALSGATRSHAHIAILALDGASRGEGLLFWRLVIEMWRHCVAEGIANLYIEVTPRILPLYQRLGWPLVITGALRLHWGEDCYLCTLGIPEVAAGLLRRAERSKFYRQIVMQAFRVALPVSKEKPAKRMIVREIPAVYAVH